MAYLRLKTARDAKMLLARLIRQLYRDEIERDKARDLGYLIKLFIDAVETSELEERVSKLERVLNESQTQNQGFRAKGAF